MRHPSWLQRKLMQGKRSERHKDGDVQKETGTRRRHWSLRNLFQCIFDDTESSENDRQWPVRDVQGGLAYSTTHRITQAADIRARGRQDSYQDGGGGGGDSDSNEEKNEDQYGDFDADDDDDDDDEYEGDEITGEFRASFFNVHSARRLNSENLDFMSTSARCHAPWNVGAFLARGSSSCVYTLNSSRQDYTTRIDSRTRGRGVVVKLPRSEGNIMQLAMEAETLYRMGMAKRPLQNVVEVFSVETAPLAIVMERFDMNFKFVLVKASAMPAIISTLKLISLLRDVVVGLQSVHEAGFTHGDVKPVNILVNKDLMVAKVADFGLSARSGTDMVFGGSKGYVAPEAAGRCHGTGPPVTIDPTMDIFSVGLILLQVLERSSEPITGLRGDTDWNPIQTVKVHDIPHMRFLQDDGFVFIDEILDVLQSLLHADPRRRCSLDDLLTLLNTEDFWARKCEIDSFLSLPASTRLVLARIKYMLLVPCDGAEWWNERGRFWWGDDSSS